LAPNYCTQDGVVPRTRVPDILRAIQQAAAKHRIRAGNVFHAGDGNIHPSCCSTGATAARSSACSPQGGILEGVHRARRQRDRQHGIGVERSPRLRSVAPDIARDDEAQAV
jgi:glycolate oxidase